MVTILCCVGVLAGFYPTLAGGQPALCILQLLAVTYRLSMPALWCLLSEGLAGMLAAVPFWAELDALQQRRLWSSAAVCALSIGHMVGPHGRQ
jgi:hypothetical protein